MNKAKLLEVVIAADKDLLAGVQLYKVQEVLREYERDINTMPLAERYEQACYGKTKDKATIALIHCREILRGNT